MGGPEQETAMTATETFQITAEQAELDEQQFVLALVEPWVGPCWTPPASSLCTARPGRDRSGVRH